VSEEEEEDGSAEIQFLRKPVEKHGKTRGKTLTQENEKKREGYRVEKGRKR
jgi:hypothetical protein